MQTARCRRSVARICLVLQRLTDARGRTVVAGFDGGKMTSDAGARLLGATDRAIGSIARFAAASRTTARPI